MTMAVVVQLRRVTTVTVRLVVVLGLPALALGPKEFVGLWCAAGLQLLAVYVSLADASRGKRLLVCFGCAILGLAMIAGRFDRSSTLELSQRLGELASLFLVMVGLLLPVRLYVGVIGLESPPATARRPSLQDLFKLTAIESGIALLLSLGNPAERFELFWMAVGMVFASLSAVAAVLGESRVLRKVGFACVLLLVTAVIGSALTRLEPLYLTVFVVAPLAAAGLLRLQGYGLRQWR
jgi:hypothetical protein